MTMEIKIDIPDHAVRDIIKEIKKRTDGLVATKEKEKNIIESVVKLYVAQNHNSIIKSASAMSNGDVYS